MDLSAIIEKIAVLAAASDEHFLELAELLRVVYDETLKHGIARGPDPLLNA